MQINIEQLAFAYPNGHQALRGVSLQVPPGQRLALVGQNGSGKTTLVRHLNGLLLPSSGKVMIGDWDTQTRPVEQLAARVGYVFQNPDEQLFCKTVREEVAFGPRNLGFDPAKLEKTVEDALTRTHLQAHASRNPYDLSPTWRKMVAIASVLAMDTPILVLDEPTTGQDAAGVRRIAEVVRRAADEGKTVIAVSHDMDFVAEHFERMVAMQDGQVLADGPTAEVMAQTELLAQTGVEPAQLVRLSQTLGLPSPALTVEGLLNQLG